MNFGKHLIAALVALGAAGAASAQTSWTGFYLGGNAGYGWGKSSVSTTTVFSATGYFSSSSVPAINKAGHGDVKPAGFIGGLTTGYNYQSGHGVYGGEFDFNYDNNDDTRSATVVYPCCAPTSFTLKQTVGTDYLSTLRFRGGYANDKWLFYGTAGAAYAKIKYDALFTDTFANAHETKSLSDSKLGWTAGLGVEYAMQGKWTVKGEILHADFGSMSGTSNNLTAFSPTVYFPSNTFTHKADYKVEMIRFGINYRF